MSTIEGLEKVRKSVQKDFEQVNAYCVFFLLFQCFLYSATFAFLPVSQKTVQLKFITETKLSFYLNILIHFLCIFV